MRLTFLGAAQTVTGSCYLIETDHTSFLLDCGLFQGSDGQDKLNTMEFPIPMEEIAFVILSHAHIDHSGRLPLLARRGFKGPIHATKATRDLCAIMLPDSGHIQEMEAEYRNRKNLRAGRPIEPPIYTVADAERVVSQIEPHAYNASFQPAPDVRVVFRDAGHLLGSSIVELFIREHDVTRKLVFSGDLGNRNMPILRDPTLIAEADWLMLESTYGDRLHQHVDDKTELFVNAIEETVAQGGNVIIPSFAVGRTQELIYDLFKQKERFADVRDHFLNLPVYIDSPLATSATKVFRENTDCFDEEARSYIENGEFPLDFPNLHFTRSADDSKRLNMDRSSKIIIAASGMAEAGRIKHHLKHNLWRRESLVLFVGFQAPGTLGRSLVDGARKVRIFGDDIAVHARVEMLEGFSGHADRDGLLSWLGSFTRKPEQVIVVHGEADVMKSFIGSIQERFGITGVSPRLCSQMTLGPAISKPERHVMMPDLSPVCAPVIAEKPAPVDKPVSTDEPMPTVKPMPSVEPSIPVTAHPLPEDSAAKGLRISQSAIELNQSLRDPRVARTTWALDALQSGLVDVLESFKQEVRSQPTAADLDELLNSLQQRVNDQTKALLNDYAVPGSSADLAAPKR